mmetsp:Transcript_13551/g.28993  ORF Transcript_13551/g.28993 Transcript_13551/m.28993 type:complete len:206 (-) Transcript_13551:1070-1687(-)
MLVKPGSWCFWSRRCFCLARRPSCAELASHILAYALSRGSECCSFCSLRKPSGSMEFTCAASTLPLTSREWAGLPGMLLKSPATSMGMSALAAIFSSPLRRVWTCQSFTSFSSGFAWMCVLATQIRVRLLDASGVPGSIASSTAINATLSFSRRFSADFFWDWLVKDSARERAALLNSTSYFFTKENLSRLKNVAQPSIAYLLSV